MKKILFLLILSSVINSCSTDTGQSELSEVVLPIQTVVMATKYKRDSTSVININYLRPTNCYGFNAFYYKKDGFTRTVAIDAILVNNGNCGTGINIASTRDLEFTPKTAGTYSFKFWLGTNASGVDEFITEEAIVP